jgi:hypothetical protein
MTWGDGGEMNGWVIADTVSVHVFEFSLRRFETKLMTEMGLLELLARLYLRLFSGYGKILTCQG